MNWTACNSVFASELTAKPNDVPTKPLITAMTIIKSAEPCISKPKNVKLMYDKNAAWSIAKKLNVRAYPIINSNFPTGSDINLSSVPLVLSLKVAIEVIKNIKIRGNKAKM
jgi:hypothetical protein